VDLELLLQVSLGLDREDTSVCFLMKHVFGPLGGTTTFEEHKSPEDLFLLILELLWGQADVTVVLWTSSHILYSLPLHQKGNISKTTC